jgi:PST family polysaccharide transporter
MSTSRGLLRSGGAATVAQLVRILSLQAAHIVAGRYVAPGEWGIWVWLEPVFLLLATVRDLGVSNHVMRLKPMPFGTFLRVELIWGSTLGAAVFAGAPWIATALAGGGAGVAAGIRVLTLGLVLEGLGAVAMSWFEAKLQIERTLAAEFLRTGAYCTVVLAGAVSGLGFWSFIAGQIAGQALFALELWRRARGEIQLHHVPGSTLAVVRDSLPLMGVWWLTTALASSDAFVVGRLFDPRLLGLYGVGYSFAFLVFRVLQQPFARSLYPALVAYNEEPARQFRAYRLATLLFLALEVPAALLLAANADLVALVMRGEQYLGAAPYLALLAFAPLADPFGRFGGELLVARGLDRTRVVSLALQLGARVGGGVALSLWLGSPFGMAWANFLPLGAPVIVVALVRAGAGAELRRLTRELAGVFVAPLVPFALAWYAAGSDRWLRLALTLVAAALALAWTWYRHGADFRDFFAGPKAPVPAPAAHLETQ